MNLARYRSVSLGKEQPALHRSMEYRLGPVALAKLDTSELWAIHDNALRESGNHSSGPSLLDLKIEIAKRMLGECSLCERKCKADRTRGETGFCGVGGESSFFFEQVLWGEEAPLVPSHEIFFSGCNMRCKFCYSWESVMDPSFGKQAIPEELAGIMNARHREGAVNVNLIGGEPTVHLPVILQALRYTECSAAIVWNSNFYMSAETMRLLDGVVDLYLGDFRFGNNRCADETASTYRYFETAVRNFTLAAASGDLIIRHLLVPGHVECCLRSIAEWVAANLPETPFNLMFQYTPFFQALEDPALCRSLSPEEESEATEIVSSLRLNTTSWNRSLGLKNTKRPAGAGEIHTTITIRPDGRVGIMHLHGDLLEIAEALRHGRKSQDG